MSYKSRISNLRKFSWTASVLAITALSATQAMAAPEQLPTVEIHFEVLDKFLSQDNYQAQSPNAMPFATKPSEPIKTKTAKKPVAKIAKPSVAAAEPKKIDWEAEAAKPVATHKFKLTAKEKAAVAKGEPAPLAIPSSKMKEMPLQMPPDLQPAPAAVPALKEKAVPPIAKHEPKTVPATPAPPKVEAVPPAPVMPPIPEPKAAAPAPVPPVMEPAPAPVPPAAPIAQPPAPPAPVVPTPPEPKPNQVPLIMPEAAAPAPAPKIPAAPESLPKIEPVPQPVPMPTAALPEKSEPQKALITPMPPAPTPEDEFAKALNAPVTPNEAIKPTPVVPVPPPAEAKKEVAPPAPAPAPAAEVHKEEGAKIATQNGKTLMTIPFIATETDLPLAFEGDLKSLAARVKKNDEHLTLVAYASESADQSTMARRVSLSRVLAVRAFLIEQGVNKLNINVQAEGSKNPGGEPNRVDIFINDGKSK